MQATRLPQFFLTILQHKRCLLFSNFFFFFLEKTEKHQENEVNDEEFN